MIIHAICKALNTDADTVFNVIVMHLLQFLDSDKIIQIVL